MAFAHRIATPGIAATQPCTSWVFFSNCWDSLCPSQYFNFYFFVKEHNRKKKKHKIIEIDIDLSFLYLFFSDALVKMGDSHVFV